MLKKFSSVIFILVVFVSLFGIGFASWFIYYPSESLETSDSSSIKPEDVTKFDKYIEFTRTLSTDKSLKFTRYGFISDKDGNPYNKYSFHGVINTEELKTLNEDRVKIVVEIDYHESMGEVDGNYDLFKYLDNLEVSYNNSHVTKVVDKDSLKVSLTINLGSIVDSDIKPIDVLFTLTFDAEMNKAMFSNEASPLKNKNFGFVAEASLSIILE